MRHRLATAALIAIVAAAGLPSATRAGAGGAVGLKTRLDRLEAEVTAGEDVLAIEKLQRAYGYYVDKGMWEDVAQLFTQDAVANYPAGVFIGWKSIREHLYMNVGGKKMGELGLGDGRLYDHMNIQPVVHLDPGGKTARGRWRAFAMFGNFGGGAVWAEGVYEIGYAKVDGVWKIRKLDYYDGFGAPYQTGWAAPAAPRGVGGRGTAGPGGAPLAAVRRAFRHLAHPPDRPRVSCGGFPKACLAPFDYSNPGTTAAGAAVWSVSARDVAAVAARHRGDENLGRRAAQLAHRAELLSDAQQIENLQRIYGYYLDRADWDQVADLFAEDGTIELAQRGVYVGKARIREFLGLLGHHGLVYGWLNDHIQLQPIVDVSADGLHARSRSRELDMTGVYQTWGKWSEGTYENTYVKRNGVWKIASLHYYPTFITDYDKGWAKDAEPAPAASEALPPDRPPSEVYQIYPKAFVPPFHYRNPATGEPPHYPPVGAPSSAAAAAMLAPLGRPWSAPRVRSAAALVAAAERTIERVKDYDEIENLESAYGYYLDKDLWNGLADLFSADGTMELAQRGVYETREHIRTFLFKVLGRGHEGPVAGMLGNHMQLQPVIDVAPDGLSAKIRIRMFQQMAFGSRASVGAAIYENVAIKQDGIWRLQTDHTYNTLGASYEGGWVRGAHPGVPGESKEYPPDAPPTGKVAMFPVVYDIPFHYANPVTGRTAVPLIGASGEAPVTAAADPPASQAPALRAPSGMAPNIASALREMGARIDPRTAQLYAPLFPHEPYPNVALTRDVHYGPHERNVLDIFTAPAKGHAEPVLVFIHGGGFSRGSKHTAGTPFYDNIGLWAAAHGLVGVTMNYRLAPQFQFPSGIEDVTAAVRFLHRHIAAYGGDPHEIFLWGHSAGAAHVADYLAHVATTAARPAVAGAILTSGFYDLGNQVSIWKDYYGTDVSKYPERSSLPGLLKTPTPLLVTDAELDPPMMREQTDELTAARAKEGRPVERVFLPNHSHLSETYAVGTPDESLSAPVLEFIRRVSGER
ncbi:MAG TPA: nuclear transport factor 2 family protein [Steroidobacteraceae bacterium]|nr:nuclear transport factor 2 family protein [Steroidobacteraceae bacterium]